MKDSQVFMLVGAIFLASDKWFLGLFFWGMAALFEWMENKEEDLKK